MTLTGQLRLDEELWIPTALGTVGPHLLLAGSLSTSHMAYRPLLRTHLRAQDGDLLTELFVKFLPDRAAILEERSLSSVASAPALRRKSRSRDQDFVGLLFLADDDVVGHIVAERTLEDRRVARILSFAHHRPEQTNVMILGWSSLFQSLAQRGILGVIVNERRIDVPLRQTLSDLIGFRSVQMIATDFGVADVDVVRPIAHWTLQIDDDRVVSFVVRAGEDVCNAEQVECAKWNLSRCFAYVADPDLASDEIKSGLPATPTFGVKVDGDIMIGGALGWSTGERRDGSDFADNLSDTSSDWRNRIPLVVAAWLREPVTQP